MRLLETNVPLKDYIESVFYKKKDQWFSKNDFFGNKREEAFERFTKIGFPSKKMESWRFTDIAPILRYEYKFTTDQPEKIPDPEKLFQCEVTDLETHVITQINGWYAENQNPLFEESNGLIYGSLKAAYRKYPDLVKKYIAKSADYKNDAFLALNTALAQDGFFVFVPANTIIDKPIQLISIIFSNEVIFSNLRNLIIIEKNSSARIVNCEHTLSEQISLSNNVFEFFIEEGAHLDYYDFQNKGSNSALISNKDIIQKKNSNFSSNTISLNGGLIRNNMRVQQKGSICNSDLYGIYLLDRNQHIDNQTFIDHAFPSCTSNELYKGILDESSQAVFTGRILVRKEAQEISAFQNNKNILFSDGPKVNSQPQLEIYADNVKCSHGATVGQLDEDALFYLKARGLDQYQAKMILMSAFAGEVIEKISIPLLKDRIYDLVSKRLKGELSVCDQCVFCDKHSPTVFYIDVDKVNNA